VESYIVRIYRRGPDVAAEATGTVEYVGSGRRRGFRGPDELIALLLGRADDDGGPDDHASEAL
jgi:hypothetical protein